MSFCGCFSVVTAVLAVFLVPLLFFATDATAQEVSYRSLRTDRAYMRTAPGLDKPVRWVYRKRGLPFLALRGVDRWWNVRDWQGEEGWIHSSQLSSVRSAIVVAEETLLLRAPDTTADKLAVLRYQVVMEIESCGQEWCEVAVTLPEGRELRGWVGRAGIWGLQAGEILE